MFIFVKNGENSHLPDYFFQKCVLKAPRKFPREFQHVVHFYGVAMRRRIATLYYWTTVNLLTGICQVSSVMTRLKKIVIVLLLLLVFVVGISFSQVDPGTRLTEVRRLVKPSMPINTAWADRAVRAGRETLPVRLMRATRATMVIRATSLVPAHRVLPAALMIPARWNLLTRILRLLRMTPTTRRVQLTRLPRRITAIRLTLSRPIPVTQLIRAVTIHQYQLLSFRLQVSRCCLLSEYPVRCS